MWFTRVSIQNPVFATMVMAALCVLGLFSYSQLRVERLPDISPPIVFISVAYPGASPEAVEAEITRPLELALNGNRHLDHLLVSLGPDGEVVEPAEYRERRRARATALLGVARG